MTFQLQTDKNPFQFHISSGASESRGCAKIPFNRTSSDSGSATRTRQ